MTVDTPILVEKRANWKLLMITVMGLFWAGNFVINAVVLDHYVGSPLAVIGFAAPVLLVSSGRLWRIAVGICLLEVCITLWAGLTIPECKGICGLVSVPLGLFGFTVNIYNHQAMFLFFLSRGVFFLFLAYFIYSAIPIEEKPTT